MMKQTLLLFSFFLFWTASGHAHAYYIAASGSNQNDGSKARPWKTLDALSRIRLNADDTLYFRGGDTFYGTWQPERGSAGARLHPIVVTSYGRGRALIDGGNAAAIVLFQVGHIHIRGLELRGAGRKTGNTDNGLAINTCHDIIVDSCVISGFQKAGLFIYRSSDIQASGLLCRDNGYAGIYVDGPDGTRDCNHILLRDCRAENNPGDPTNLTNHSGNGILVGHSRKVRVEKCIATNNGWDMPRAGNGPVGIWAYESDSVVISHCISFRNKTSKGADDGGGFDLDGGMTHSVIEYCLSYENEGSAFGVFQYAGASPWGDNSVHDCISNNDGMVSPAHAGVFIWNETRDARLFKNFTFYNNVVYSIHGGAIHYAEQDGHAGFRFYDNVFISSDSLIKGRRDPADVFIRNQWTGLLPDSTYH